VRRLALARQEAPDATDEHVEAPDILSPTTRDADSMSIAMRGVKADETKNS